MPPEKKAPPYDYLKYYRVIKYYYCIRYKLTFNDLDMLLFLYSERYFTRAKFDEFDNLLPWEKHRFPNLVKNGWVDVFRIAKVGERYLYGISIKGRRMIKDMYNKLNGDEITVNNTVNPMFAKNVRYTDKVYRKMILQMNAEIKEKKKTEGLKGLPRT